MHLGSTSTYLIINHQYENNMYLLFFQYCYLELVLFIYMACYGGNNLIPECCVNTMITAYKYAVLTYKS